MAHGTVLFENVIPPQDLFIHQRLGHRRNDDTRPGQPARVRRSAHATPKHRSGQ